MMTKNKMMYRQIDKFIFPKRVALANIFGPPILVWTMTKVGTTSIARSLQTKLGKYRVFGEHTLNLPDWPRSVTLYNEFIIKKKPIKIITAVRDPISQSVSNFFHRYSIYTGDNVISPQLTVEETMNKFLSTEFDFSWETWFEKNLERYLDIDVYNYPFSVKKGYVTIEKGNAEVLLIKSEIENSLKEKAIKEFLNIDDFRIKNKNLGDSKAYSKTYKRFKKEAKFPNEYLDYINKSKYLNHFYSSIERDAIFQKWSADYLIKG
ncbi:putative capsular polysaccharide synthesis family protein [Leptothoe sp. EHU-05/26/07-4]